MARGYGLWVKAGGGLCIGAGASFDVSWRLPHRHRPMLLEIEHEPITICGIVLMAALVIFAIVLAIKNWIQGKRKR